MQAPEIEQERKAPAKPLKYAIYSQREKLFDTLKRQKDLEEF